MAYKNTHTYLGLRWASRENIASSIGRWALAVLFLDSTPQSKRDRAAMNGVKYLETPRSVC